MPFQRECLLGEWSTLPPLPEREVQVFALRTDRDPGLVKRAEAFLSPAELERAGRFRVVQARDEFVVGRAALRVLLGSASGIEPKSLAIRVDSFGKPFVPGVHSNVSHSRGLIYLALCRAVPIGIDVEWIDPDLEALEIAQANFTEEETLHLAAQPAGQERARAFCNLWTRKEAVAKAHGEGLRMSLRDIRVPRGGAGQATISSASDANHGAAYAGVEEFFVQELAAPPGFVAALAIRGRAVPLKILL